MWWKVHWLETLFNNTDVFKVTVRELGGFMAPLWHHYFHDINKVMFVVDASNLCQIAAAGVLLYTILTEPKLKNAKVNTFVATIIHQISKTNVLCIHRVRFIRQSKNVF